MPEVPRRRTPLTEAELVESLAIGHEQRFGHMPSTERLACGWAQCALELTRGKDIWNFNLGNITTGSQWRGDYYRLKTKPPDPPFLDFRSHETAVDGASDYWHFLATQRGYQDVLPLFDKGAAYDASMELGRLNYYLADHETYSNGVASLYREFNRRDLESDIVRYEIVPTREELAVAGRLWRLHNEISEGQDPLDMAMVKDVG